MTAEYYCSSNQRDPFPWFSGCELYWPW